MNTNERARDAALNVLREKWLQDAWGIWEAADRADKVAADIDAVVVLLQSWRDEFVAHLKGA